MNRKRLNNLARKLKVELSNYQLIAFKHSCNPEMNSFRVYCNGNTRYVTEEEWEDLAQKVPNGQAVMIIDDIT